MPSSCVLEVDLINCSDAHPASVEFYNVVTRLAGSFIVHKHTPKHLYLFTYPDFKIPDTSEEVEYSSSTWLYKDRNTLVTIPRHYLASLNNELIQQYEHMVKRKPRILYDAESGTFKPYKQKDCSSKTIQPVGVTVSLKETKDGNANLKANKNRSPGVAVRYQETFLTKSHVTLSSHNHHLQDDNYVVPGYECTDGPEENVVFHVSPSIKNNLSDVDAAPTESLPILDATRDSASARGPSRRARLSCRHPDYEEEEARAQSFRAWPLQRDVQDVNNLAANGFFYTGRFDLVRCYQCGLGLKDWSFQEDPLIEHVRYSPHCLHLAETVDPARLQQLQLFNTPTDRASVNPHASSQAGGPRLRHPEYQSLETRVNSYKNWPRDLLQTPQLLSEAGFYYTGFQDQVRCYACDGGLQHWDADDDPWIEHARWFSHCHHVTMVKGDNYVRMVQMALASSDDEEDLAIDELSTEDLSKCASGGGLVSDDPIYSPAAQAVITQFGFSTAAVRMALRECTDKGVRLTQEKLVNILLDKQQRGEVLPADSPRSQSPASPEADVSTDAGLRAEHSKLRHRLMCLLCETKAADVLFLPCAHHKMCSHCAGDVTMCPVCEKQVKEKVKTFMV